MYYGKMNIHIIGMDIHCIVCEILLKTNDSSKDKVKCETYTCSMSNKRKLVSKSMFLMRTKWMKNKVWLLTIMWVIAPVSGHCKWASLPFEWKTGIDNVQSQKINPQVFWLLLCRIERSWGMKFYSRKREKIPLYTQEPIYFDGFENSNSIAQKIVRKYQYFRWLFCFLIRC